MNVQIDLTDKEPDQPEQKNKQDICEVSRSSILASLSWMENYTAIYILIIEKMATIFSVLATKSLVAKPG